MFHQPRQYRVVYRLPNGYHCHSVVKSTGIIHAHDTCKHDIHMLLGTPKEDMTIVQVIDLLDDVLLWWLDNNYATKMEL